MKASFAELWEMVCLETNQDSGDTKTVIVLLKQNPEFWRQLADISRSDSEGLAELLGVGHNDVLTWYGKIRKAQDVADRARAENNKDTMVSTGIV